jgi:hypothetical protein
MQAAIQYQPNQGPYVGQWSAHRAAANSSPRGETASWQVIAVTDFAFWRTLLAAREKFRRICAITAYKAAIFFYNHLHTYTHTLIEFMLRIWRQSCFTLTSSPLTAYRFPSFICQAGTRRNPKNILQNVRSSATNICARHATERSLANTGA